MVSESAGKVPQPSFLEALCDFVSQLFSTPSFEERTSLVFETLDAQLGFPEAALLLADWKKSIFRILSPGSEGSTPEISLESTASTAKILFESASSWITRDEGQYSPILELFPSSTALYGIPLTARYADGAEEFGPGPDQHKRYQRGELTTFGVLVVAAAGPGETEDEELTNLERFARIVAPALTTAIQEQKSQEAIRKLKRESQWINSIMKSVADPIILTNLDNAILLQNQRAALLFSDRGDEPEAKRRALQMNDLLFSAYLSSAAVASQEVLSRELTLVDPVEGTDLHFEVTSSPALDAKGDQIGHVSVFRDVTDLKLANEELERNLLKLQRAEQDARRDRDRLESIIENVGQPVVVTDGSGTFLLSNRRAEAFLDDKNAAGAGAVSAVQANAVKFTSFISGLVSETTQTREDEIELMDPGSGKWIPMTINSAKIYDSRDELVAVVSILQDLSQVRELERRRVERQLFESEKLAAVGRLAASIAHEVNNPLEAIKNSLYLIKSSDEPGKDERFLSIALQETERVSQVIRQMLGLTRRSEGREWVSVSRLIEETLVLFEKKMHKAGIRVVLQLAKGLPSIHAHPDQLRQVFLNLLLNAQQAIPKGSNGRITLKTTSSRIFGDPAVRIEFRDNGCGISEENQERIFEPFFSTRKKGTGLGLWITKDIIQRHGGRLEVSSKEDKGTNFVITLPVDHPEEEEGGANA